jgi:hypothetical protein
MGNLFIKILRLLVILIFSAIATLTTETDVNAICSEPGNFLICEDWDGDPPPPHSNWPCGKATGGGTCDSRTGNVCCAVWRGWRTADYLSSAQGKSGVTSTYAHSGTKSLRQTSQYINGGGPATDIDHSISGNPTVVYIRFYIYVTNLSDVTIGHFIFLNTASSAEVALDWRDCLSEDWHTCDGGRYLVPHSYSPEVWLANNQGTERFNWNNHLNEWVLVEWKVDFANDRSSLWINEVPHLIDWSVDWSPTYATSVIISGWRSLGTQNDQSYWIDDFVVSTNYIGPRRAVSAPSPPTGLKIVQ